jgi:hypothetical protein
MGSLIIDEYELEGVPFQRDSRRIEERWNLIDKNRIGTRPL